MELLGFVLYPLILLLQTVLEAIYAVVPSYGLAIVLLSSAVRFAMRPIIRTARQAEERHARVVRAMEPELATIRGSGLTGRDRFERIETLYEKHGYHPAHSMLSLVPLLLQLPFLLAALIFLTHYPPLSGQPFLFLSDLGKPDGLVPIGFISAGAAINALPFALTAVAVVESFVKPDATRSTRIRFLVVSAVILALIYPLPAAVCLYWLTSNCWSLVSEIMRPSRSWSEMGEKAA